MSKLSVVIPTYKPRYLEETLEGLSKQIDKNFEVIVVENGVKSKNAEQNIKSFSEKFDLNYLFESQSGANLARNIGCNNAHGSIIALIDDDCVPNPDWISEIKKSHILYPSAGVIGGKVDLKFRDCEPKWLQGIFRNYLAEMNWGSKSREIEDYEYLVGANFTFRIDVFNFVEGFNTGKDQERLRANDEFIFLNKSKNSFSPGAIYVPEIKVTHTIPEDRTNTKYFMEKSYNQGIADIFLKKQINLNFNLNEAYAFLRLQMEENRWDWKALNELEKKLDSEVFREYEARFLATRVEYLKGIKFGIDTFLGELN